MADTVSPINPVWLANMEERIAAIPDCSALNALATEITADFANQLTSIVTQRSALAPLLTNPSDLSKVISFCTQLYNIYKNQDVALLLMQTAMLAEQTRILALLVQKRDLLTCSFTMPTPYSLPTAS